MTNDVLKQTLLDTVQSGFPLAQDPYGVLAQQLGASKDQVMCAMEQLFSEGGVRRVGASFDSRKLGYASTLCALAVPGGHDELSRAAAVVSAVPGVTHNYGRAHRYNLWFTLITRTPEDKAAILDDIRTATDCTDLLDMPATKKYKISVDFGAQHAAQAKLLAEGRHDAAKAAAAGHSTTVATVVAAGKAASNAAAAAGNGAAAAGNGAAGSAAVGAAGNAAAGVPTAAGAAAAAFDPQDSFDVALVRWAQGDVAHSGQGALSPDPFADGAVFINSALNSTDVDADAVITRIEQLKSARTIRRFGAMVRHHNIGFSHNSMTVWDIPDSQVDAAGALFAQVPFVSHCYTRLRQETWPVNLYAMTHAQSSAELQENVASLAGMLAAAGIPCQTHFALDTTDEFKKTSMKYFEEDR